MYCQYNEDKELEILENVRKSCQKEYDKIGVTLTIDDAKEIRKNLVDLVGLLLSWKNKNKNKKEDNEEKI